jgi:hypothetical protein
MLNLQSFTHEKGFRDIKKQYNFLIYKCLYSILDLFP